MDATTVGVDLAKNVFVACVADCAGRIMERREFNRAGFLTWLGTLLAGTVIGMEACGSAHHWGRTAQRLGLAPRLMAADFVRPYRKRQSVKFRRSGQRSVIRHHGRRPAQKTPLRSTTVLDPLPPFASTLMTVCRTGLVCERS